MLYLTIFILWGVESPYMTLLVIQVHRSKIVMREEKAANWKIRVNLYRNEPSVRD
jgi:hypothetical protein